MIGDRADRIARLMAVQVETFASTPLRTLEITWLDATCLYEMHDNGMMPDGVWDMLSKYLYRQRNKLSPYFRHSVPMACLESSTGSGIDWTRGIPKLSFDATQEPE